MSENLVIIGKISKPQGLRGEVRLWLDSIPREIFRELKKVTIEYPSGKEEAIFISKCTPHKDFFKVKFCGVESREQAEELRNCIVKVLKDDLPYMEGFIYDFDLINLSVYTQEELLIGSLTDVWHLPANDVYVVNQKDGKEFLIPAIDQIVLEIDLENRKMVIFPMEGLLDT